VANEPNAAKEPNAANEPETAARGRGGIGRSEPLRVAAAAATVALWVADLVVPHSGTQKVLGLALVAVLCSVTVSDLEERRIKNRVTFPAAIVALAIGLALHPSGVPGQILAGVLAGAALTLVALLTRGGLGLGDAKLALVLGLYLSGRVVLALLVGFAAAGLLGLAVLARRGLREGRRTAIPLGPFLALGGVVALLSQGALGRGAWL